MKKAILYLSLLSFVSCSASVIYQPIVPNKYPPSKKVDVYEDAKPTKEFTQIGLIIVSSEGGTKIMTKKAIKKAMEIGADGIILAEKIDDTDRWRVDTRYRIPGKSYMKFLVIKYIKKDE